VAVSVGFDAALEPGQFSIRQQLSPSAQIKIGLRAVLRKFNC
jgi:hypothetical protein